MGSCLLGVSWRYFWMIAKDVLFKDKLSFLQEDEFCLRIDWLGVFWNSSISD